MSIIRNYYRTIFITLLLANFFIPKEFVTAQKIEKNKINNVFSGKLQENFKYIGDGSIIISGHRGGLEVGFPENSLEGFRNVLRQIPAFFEIDPRLTKDSAIVLMHDPTLDRTTTGKGNLSEYTLEQLKQLRLKDNYGNLTAFVIPTLEEAIIWSRGKTILNLDKKVVPMEMIVALIKKLHAEDHVMLTIHDGKQAKYYYDRFPDIKMSVLSRTMKEYEDIASSGVPWRNMIAYVGPAINDENSIIVEKLHAKGVRCMISVAPTHDRLKSSKERQEAYLEEINKQPDIIETDLPVEVWKALQLRRIL